MLKIPWTISTVKNKHETSTIHMPTIPWTFFGVKIIKRPHDNNHSSRFSFMTLWDGLQGVRTIGHWFKELWRARKRSWVESEKSEEKQ